MPLPITIPLPGGLAMPAVGLGTFRARGADVAGAVAAALAEGYRHIDTAAVYKNEADIASAIAASGLPRDQLFITSKVSPYQQGTEAAIAACEASLAALHLACPGAREGNAGSAATSSGGGGSTDTGGSGTGGSGACSGSAWNGAVIDLMLIHWPGVAKQPLDSPANAELRRQTWRVLEGYHRRGAFRAIGVSNYEARHVRELLGYAEVAPAVNQVEGHPRYQQKKLRALCAEHGIAVVAYASYGSGALLSDPAVLAAAHAAGAAAGVALTPAQALLLWGLHRGLAVIPKSVRAERLAEVAPARLAQLDAVLQVAGALGALLGSLDALGEEEPCKFCWDPAGVA